MKGKNIILASLIMLLLAAFFAGCQKQAEELKEMPDAIEIVDETPQNASGELEKEFDDGLDIALRELEGIEEV